MANFPKDRFDTLPDDLVRVGAHRAPKRAGAGWITFAWAALATGVLVGAGLIGVGILDSSLSFTEPTSEAAPGGTTVPTAEPVTDPATVADREITVTVLNGTATAGLQDDAATVLEDQGWTIGSQASSSATDITQTIVYYSDAANEDVARGIVLAIGVGDVRLSDAYQGAPVTVVVGSDFVPAG
ncbi:LytR cell envelope-related transcriptional attenuator [Glaciihabitans tibetensis]|uniref:LytR cell envelope-related transcriptional attenuator n=1 Tax=Glaciihabitans tibetensis TaxID=1266600 RepID=A0A2T0VAI7_9MICO|nr:LytR C-terminal domain-containing protein [Glaciihabitans tibetensis]PRY67173.1 LytR cell envelope-related transcriptional attenuator [Glaciihabitans tibetensis]